MYVMSDLFSNGNEMIWKKHWQQIYSTVNRLINDTRITFGRLLFAKASLVNRTKTVEQWEINNAEEKQICSKFRTKCNLFACIHTYLYPVSFLEIIDNRNQIKS